MPAGVEHFYGAGGVVGPRQYTPLLPYNVLKAVDLDRNQTERAELKHHSCGLWL